jgi:heme/copper-type cytochrome/quinol oxidase subunit 2
LDLGERKVIVAIVVILAATAAVVVVDLNLKPVTSTSTSSSTNSQTSSVTATSSSTNSTTTQLPSGCSKPVNGFLIVASNTGYNDSEFHYNDKPWPVITVTQGQTVDIEICNIDSNAHGFEIQHYHDDAIYSVGPQQVTQVTFVAGESGDFTIYCSILCEVHIYMQYGELVVNPS